MAKQKLILDSSVIIKFILSQGESDIDKANLILERTAANKLQLLAPVLAKEEVGNVIKNRKFSREEKLECWAKFSLIPIKYIDLDFKVGLRILEIALEMDITFYDAEFVAQAENLKISLVTANPKHQKSFGNTKVVALQDYK